MNTAKLEYTDLNLIIGNDLAVITAVQELNELSGSNSELPSVKTFKQEPRNHL